MLQHLVERYLDNLPNERAFDATFLALLAADAYSDIHLTHGPLEFGKDIIAKREVDGTIRQFVFQNKAGNMAMADWRNTMPQLLNAVTSPLSHPGFDTNLPRTVLLVLTGRLRGAAAVDLQAFKNTTESQFPSTRIDVLDRESLIALFLRHGPEQLFRSGVDVRGYGRFYRLYGDVLEGSAKLSDVDLHFEERLHADAPRNERLAATAIESALFADAARQTSQLYLALLGTLATLRAVMYEMRCADDDAGSIVALCAAAIAAVVEQALALAHTYLSLTADDRSLADVAGTLGKVIAYPVVCAQLSDALVIVYSLGVESQRYFAADALARLVESEPGCAHPISDRYAVSVVEAIRVLHDCGRDDLANTLLKACALWLIDCYWDGGFGLAASDGDERDEISQLFGGPFSSIAIERNSASLLATALMDAACFLQNKEVFIGLRADILAADIVPRYYQPQDSRGQFEVAALDVIRFPNVEFSEAMPEFSDLRHGAHLHGEPRSYALDAILPKGTHVAVALLLRDRWFPTTWV